MSYIRYYLPEFINTGIMYCVGKARCYIQPYINNTFSANSITDRIFVGDLASAANKEAMKEQGITHIISAITGAYPLFPQDFTYLTIHINDDAWVNIGEYFESVNNFIDETMKSSNTKIMIHCQKGISRSVTLLMGYLLFKYNTHKQIPKGNVDEAINNILREIREHRSIAEPNEGFIQALKKYIYTLNGY
jgi:predicted protein tyrosine phosphatase